MKKIILFIFIMTSLKVYAQKKYFQQDVAYKINVTLDDENHVLRGFETLRYTNNSYDTLRYVIFHLWPNAYKDDKSTYTEHEVENGDTKFYFSKEVEKGFIDSLEFKVDGENVNLSNFNNLEDVVLIELNHPLLPKETIEFSTPFRVVIPEVFSRLGHDEQAYQITQWYPKPAVYDLKGWHPLPYLDQGEFYSEFGSFDVTISVPENYVVAATGDLQNDNEKKFIKNITTSKDTSKRNLESSKDYKTITFKQEHVHDFAWFANKSFLVEKYDTLLPSGKTVSCYSYFKPENKKKYVGSSKIIAQTIAYLSKHVGEYPYNHASIVDGKLLAGGGMEYPNITVIGKMNSKSELQTVIVHEVGHNWFQGILGSNERDHAWMDEGINSFYERKIDGQIGSGDTNIIMQKINKASKELNGNFIYFLTAKQHKDQAIDIPSQDFTSMNYGGMVYNKTASMLKYLESYLGEELFEKAMKQYFKEWNLKHPYPEDFRKIMERETGKNLCWFFDDGLNSTKKIDYKITNVVTSNYQTQITVKNNKNFKGPIPVNALMNDSIVETKWIEYPYSTSANFSQNSTIDAYKIDANKELPDINLTNNFYEKNRLFHRLKIKPKIGSAFSMSETNQLFILPALGYNYYDKAMLGLTFHNLKIPNNKLQYAFAPMFSFGSKSFVGSCVIGYSIFPKTTFQKITFSLQGNTYHHNRSNLNLSKYIFARHIKISPSILFEFRNPVARSPISNSLSLQFIAVLNQSFDYTRNIVDSLYRPSVSNYEKSHYGVALFTHKNKRTFNPFSYSLKAEGNNTFIKLGLTTDLRIDYNQKNKAFYVRGFAGKFFDLKNNANPFALRNQYLNATFTADNDYAYNDVYLARNEQKGFLSQQVSMSEGGFKVKTNLLSSPIGMNNNWLMAVNLRTDLPIKSKIKLQLFLDAATYANAGKLNPSGNKAIYEAGAELHILKDILVIYAPLILSKDLKDYTKSNYSKQRILNTMSFSLNLNKLNFLQTQDVMNLFMP